VDLARYCQAGAGAGDAFSVDVPLQPSRAFRAQLAQAAPLLRLTVQATWLTRVEEAEDDAWSDASELSARAFLVFSIRIALIYQRAIRIAPSITN